MNSFARFLLRWIGGVFLGIVLIAAVVWGMVRSKRRPQWETDAAAVRAQGMANYHSQPVAPWKPGTKHADFIKLIQDLYDVESAQFVRDDYLRVTFLPIADEEEQGTCQAIANIWFSRQPQPQILVESYHGQTRTAGASVIDGNMITPPQPTGRRSTKGKAAAKAAAMAAFSNTEAGKEQMARIDQTEQRIKRLMDLRREMEGKPYAAVVAAHGDPLSKDAVTGWAAWKDFRVQFQTGKAVTVEITD